MAKKREENKTGAPELKGVEERARWAIIRIIERNHLSNAKLGKIMGCSKGTIDNYRRRNTTPDMMFIHKLVEMYGLDIVWLHHGEGEPFLGDGRGPGEREESEILDTKKTGFKSRKSRKLTKLVTDVVRIAESGPPFEDMLYYGVEHLVKTLKTQQRNAELERENKSIRESLALADQSDGPMRAAGKKRTKSKS